MIGTILVILLLLWLVGLLDIPSFHLQDIVLLNLFGHPISLLNILTFALVLWLITFLPRPLQAIATIIFILWILSILGIIAITGFSNIIVLLIIVGFISMFL